MVVKLRKLEKKDANFMLEWMKDPLVINLLRINGKEKTVRDCEEFIEKAQDLTKTAHFAIADVNTDEYYGTVSLKNIDAEKGEAEYAIATRSKVHGTGTAASATRQILDYAFLTLKLNRVYLNVLSENIRAKKFYDKMGFTFVKTDGTAIGVDGREKELDWFETDKQKYIADKPLVTCVIPVYKKFDYLFDGLNSVFLQDYPKIELFVTDDGSDNFPENEIIGFIEKNKRENIVRYEVIHNPENIGTVKNMNGAYKKGKGDFFIGLDGDDVFYDETVMTKVVERFLTTKTDLLVCSRLKCNEELNPIEIIPNAEHLKHFHKLNTVKKQFASFSHFRFYETASGSSMYYSKEHFEKYGYFDETFRLWEDGPKITSYVAAGNILPTAFDIVSIKYRLGGVSLGGFGTSVAKNLNVDEKKFIEKFIVPYKYNRRGKHARKLLFNYYWETAKTKKERIKILLKYPSKLFKLIFKRTVY